MTPFLNPPVTPERKCSAQVGHVVDDSTEHLNIALASPPSGEVSRTLPLLPSSRWMTDADAPTPLDEFSVSSSLAATDLCLKAACSLLQFDVAEIWTYAGDHNPAEGKAVIPRLLHVYTTPTTIESFGTKIKGMLSEDNKDVRHILSPELVDEARKKEDVLWYTSTNPNTPLHVDLPLNTAVAFPVSLDVFHRDLCFVFFAENDVHRCDAAVSVLTQLSKAAGVAMSAAFPTNDREDMDMHRTLRASGSESLGVSSCRTQPARAELASINVDIRWDELTNVEFMVNGSRCTIYTAFYNCKPVVAKVVRKDAADKELVCQELDLEMDILMRLQHPNIVRLLGAGTRPERFLLIERLDGGTLAQRCGNALNVRDRRSRFRHKRHFTYEEILRHGVALAEALDYMHTEALPGKLVIHRDLKPDNIGFDKHGKLKLIDFGLGRVVPVTSDDDAVYEMTGETGSLRYMAPEVALGKPYNGAADVHSFAIVLWEMATMTKPFEDMGRKEFLHRVVMNGVRPHVKKKWPLEFSKLLADGWHADMNMRPKFAELRATLGSLLEAAASSAAQARSVPWGQHNAFGLIKAQAKKALRGTFA